MAYAALVVLRTVTSPLKPLPQSLVTENATAEDAVAARGVVGAATTAGAASVTAGDGVAAGSLLAIVMVALRSAIVARCGAERLIEKVSFGS